MMSRNCTCRVHVVGYLVDKADPAPDVGCGGRGGELPNGI